MKRNEKENEMKAKPKFRILKGAEYQKAYKEQKCTGTPIISVLENPEDWPWASSEELKKTKWVRKPGSGEWIEIEIS